MAFRSVGMQIQTLPIKSFYYSSRYCDCLRPAEQKPSGSYRRYNPSQNRQTAFCEQLNYQIGKASAKSCCLIEDTATAWYRRQKDIRAMLLTQKQCKTETNLRPNLVLKPPIRKVAPVIKQMENVSYISPEFQELLRKHDEYLRQKYILNYLPEEYIRTRSAQQKDKVKLDLDKLVKSVCTCKSFHEQLAGKPDGKLKASVKNCLNCFACWNKQSSDEDFSGCHCVTDAKPGESAKCKVCLRRLKRRSAKYLAKNPRFWVGTKGEVNRRKREAGGASSTSLASRKQTVFNILSETHDISKLDKTKATDSEITLKAAAGDSKAQHSNLQPNETKIETPAKQNLKKPVFKMSLKKLFRRYKNIERKSSQAIKTSKNSVSYVYTSENTPALQVNESHAHINPENLSLQVKNVSLKRSQKSK